MTSVFGGAISGAVHIGIQLVHADHDFVDELTRVRGETATSAHAAPPRSNGAMPTPRDRVSRSRPATVELAAQQCQQAGER